MRVIYTDFNQIEQFNIVDYLYEKYGWDPAMFIGSDSINNRIKNKYGNAIFQNSMDLRIAKFDYSQIGKPIPVDSTIIYTLSKYESSCLNLLEDTNGWNFSFYERRRYYYDLLTYCNTLLNYLKPNIYINFTWPHVITDYVMYLFCKHLYNIPVLFIDPTPYFDQYQIVGVSLENPSQTYDRFYESEEKLEINSSIKDYIDRTRSNKGYLPVHMRDFHKKLRMSTGFDYKGLYKLIRMTILKKGVGFKKANLSWKKNKKPFDLPDSKMNHFEYFWFKNTLRLNNVKLQKIYDGFVEEPDYSKKYLYFAAPYQPEATTSPNAGVYVDLFLVLDILSSAVPEDWIIYYKEHPSTFLYANLGFLKGSLRRDYNYFRKIASYNNIKMISSSCDSFKLIDSSKVVSTAAGSTCWEAVVRGIPAMFFGNVWYQGCKSIFWIKTLQDAKEAIGKILNGWKPDQVDIERYAAAIEKVAVKGMIHRDFSDRIKKSKDPQFEMERIAKALYEAYAENYKNL